MRGALVSDVGLLFIAWTMATVATIYMWVEFKNDAVILAVIGAFNMVFGAGYATVLVGEGYYNYSYLGMFNVVLGIVMMLYAFAVFAKQVATQGLGRWGIRS